MLIITKDDGIETASTNYFWKIFICVNNKNRHERSSKIVWVIDGVNDICCLTSHATIFPLYICVGTLMCRRTEEEVGHLCEASLKRCRCERNYDTINFFYRRIRTLIWRETVSTQIINSTNEHRNTFLNMWLVQLMKISKCKLISAKM